MQALLPQAAVAAFSNLLQTGLGLLEGGLESSFYIFIVKMLPMMAHNERLGDLSDKNFKHWTNFSEFIIIFMR